MCVKPCARCLAQNKGCHGTAITSSAGIHIITFNLTEFTCSLYEILKGQSWKELSHCACDRPSYRREWVACGSLSCNIFIFIKTLGGPSESQINNKDDNGGGRGGGDFAWRSSPTSLLLETTQGTRPSTAKFCEFLGGRWGWGAGKCLMSFWISCPCLLNTIRIFQLIWPILSLFI